jgi:hypothetical protein
VVGPIAGGFVAQTIGTRYVFIIIAAASAVAGIIGIPLLRETYAPVIRARMAVKNGDSEKAQMVAPHLAKGKGQILWENLVRPVMLLTRSFICFVLSLYMAL